MRSGKKFALATFRNSGGRLFVGQPQPIPNPWQSDRLCHFCQPFLWMQYLWLCTKACNKRYVFSQTEVKKVKIHINCCLMLHILRQNSMFQSNYGNLLIFNRPSCSIKCIKTCDLLNWTQRRSSKLKSNTQSNFAQNLLPLWET